MDVATPSEEVWKTEEEASSSPEHALQRREAGISALRMLSLVDSHWANSLPKRRVYDHRVVRPSEARRHPRVPLRWRRHSPERALSPYQIKMGFRVSTVLPKRNGSGHKIKSVYGRCTRSHKGGPSPRGCLSEQLQLELNRVAHQTGWLWGVIGPSLMCHSGLSGCN